MSHVILKTAEEASGKLVTMVRENAKRLALEKKKDLIIIDGPPGIDCPVISAITGVDLVLIVTEPTLSAIHNLKRVFDVAKHFSIPSIVLINKYDINLDNTNDITSFCLENNILIVGKLPYDKIVTEVIVEGKTIIEYSDEGFSNWMKIEDILNRGF